MFEGKTLLITGGTGSFGHTVLDRFLTTDIREVRVFSRDEEKQDAMRHRYQAQNPELAQKIKFYIGDVRDERSLGLALDGVNYVFHAAALKQVPSCEFFPIEAIKTNVLGTNNVLTVAAAVGVEKVICLSTDKAAYPVNAMGLSKGLMEKVFIAKSRMTGASKTLICGTRYGNVMCSRGSVIPLFIDQMKDRKPLTLTEPAMTRFMMSLEEAVELVFFAFTHAHTGDLLVQKAPACTIELLAEALQDIFVCPVGIKVIGARHGEKMHETLLTAEELIRAEDHGRYYCVPADSRNLNYDNHLSGSEYIQKDATFNSGNTHQLTLEELKMKLLEVPYIQQRLAEWG